MTLTFGLFISFRHFLGNQTQKCRKKKKKNPPKNPGIEIKWKNEIAIDIGAYLETELRERIATSSSPDAASNEERTSGFSSRFVQGSFLFSGLFWPVSFRALKGREEQQGGAPSTYIAQISIFPFKKRVFYIWNPWNFLLQWTAEMKSDVTRTERIITMLYWQPIHS